VFFLKKSHNSLKDSSSAIHCYSASEDDLLVISFNQKSDFLFATGGERSGFIHVWDMRMPKYFINDLGYHKDQVTQIEWSPTSENFFMSSSTDGCVFIWDNSKAGEE
jgi:WD40 repeat protein